MTTQVIQSQREPGADTDPAAAHLWPTGRPGIAGRGTLIFVVAGFLLLVYLGTFVDHPPGLRGFWDYPSGVIGDGLILPALLTALIIQINKLGPAQNRRGLLRWVIAGSVLGLLGGAATPLTWLLNGSTGRLWLLPAAHHFNTAGWVHLGYATITTAIIGGLFGALMEGLATGSRRRSGSQQALTSIVGLGLGMLVLIGRDSLVGIHASTSWPDLVGLGLVGGAVLALLAWKGRGFRVVTIWSDSLVVVAFLAGLIAMIVGWAPRTPAVTGIGWASLFLAAGGAATMARPRGGEYRIDVALACGTLLAAGLWRSESALDHHHSATLLWAVAAVASACLLLTVEARNSRAITQALSYGFFFVYCLLQFYLAHNILTSSAAHGIAAPSLAVSDTAFDLMVFSLIQTRFGGMAEGDSKMFEHEYVSAFDRAEFNKKLQTAEAEQTKSDPHRQAPTDDGSESGGNKPMLELGMLGFAVAIALLTLLTTAAQPLGLDRDTAHPATVRILLPLTAALVGLPYCVLARWPWSKPLPGADRKFGPDDDKLTLPNYHLVLPILAAALWLAALLVLSGGRFHLGVVSAATGIVMALLYGKSLMFNCFAPQTIAIDKLHVAFAVGIAAVLGFAGAWLVGIGLWQGPAPLSGWWLAGSALSVFIGSTAVFLLASQTLARGLPSGTREHQQLLSRQAVTNFNHLDGSVYGLNYVICIVLPLYAATRDKALHAAPLTVIASMFFIPGLLTAVIWGLENWRAIDKATQKAFKDRTVSIAMLQRVNEDPDIALEREKARVEALHDHWTVQRYAVYALMVIGMGYLAWVLLRF